MNYSIAIHGGAGTILKNELTRAQETEYKQALLDAIEKGDAILKAGGAAVDAVEISVRSLENNPLFNAGKGSVFTNDGRHEMDAAIMDGLTRSCGAVAGINHVKNPVSLARAVMEKTEHVLLTGTGAMEFAKAIDAELEGDDYFFVQHRYNQLLEARKQNGVILDHTSLKADPKKFGTVGAVAMDVKGNLAAATSTGGMTNKKYGRVGDSPLIGAGTYADNKTCAVSCTGHGEFFIRSVVAYDIACLMKYKGLSLKEACHVVVMEKLPLAGGEGGLIAVDANGNIEMPFNSEGMYRAMKTSTSEILVQIYK